jgi:hypothetical protein
VQCWSSSFEYAKELNELPPGLDGVSVDNSSEDEPATCEIDESSKDDSKWRKEKPQSNWDPEECDDDLNSDTSNTDILADLMAAYEEDIEEAKSVKFGHYGSNGRQLVVLMV